jgi:hypothetical protein
MRTIRPGDERKVAKLRRLAEGGILDLPLILVSEPEIAGIRRVNRQETT